MRGTCRPNGNTVTRPSPRPGELGDNVIFSTTFGGMCIVLS